MNTLPVELRIRGICPGYELHWIGRAPGASLQGWYRTLDEAEAAMRALA